MPDPPPLAGEVRVNPFDPSNLCSILGLLSVASTILQRDHGRQLEKGRSQGCITDVRGNKCIAPFEPLAITYLDRYLKAIASSAQEFPISDGDKAEWRRIGESIDEILKDPDACYREAFTLTVGRRKS
jgi:hypothetical protein